MKKTIFEEMGGTYIRHGDYLIPCSYLTEGRRTKGCRCMGTKTFAVFEGIPQIAISEYAYKRQAEWLFG